MSKHSSTCLNCGRFVPEGDDYCDEACAALQRPATRRKNEVEYLSDGGKLVSRVEGRPLELSDLLEIFDVDLHRWKINRWNNWEQKPGEWLHQLRLAPRKDLIDANAIVSDVLADLRDADPGLPQSSPTPKDPRYMLELNITDHHLGLLAWAAETRDDNYDHRIAERLYQWAVEELVQRASKLPGDIEQIVLVLGNDMLHVDAHAGDGSGGATTSGTIQDVDSRRKKLGRVLVRMVRNTVAYLLRQAPTVKIIVVPGNHDEDASFSLGMVVEAIFEGDPRVDVDNSPPPRKYHRYGRVLLGYAHGKDETKSRLPMLMPTEQPEMWAQTTHREWHVGHLHHKNVRGFYLETDEDMSVRIRIFPSLAPKDAWHARKGYRSVRAAEAYLWHKEFGFSGMLSATPRDGEAA